MRVSYSDLVSQFIMISFDGDAVEQYQNNVYCVRNVPFFLPLLFFIFLPCGELKASSRFWFLTSFSINLQHNSTEYDQRFLTHVES